MLTLLLLCTAIASSGAQKQPSCRGNCGFDIGSCSCGNYCEYYGNCCYDYNYYCSPTTTAEPSSTVLYSTDLTQTAQVSCRFNCGYELWSCSCTSSCWYNGNCCYDYNSYCSSTTYPSRTTEQPSCLYYCGSDMGSCSCDYSCQYYGNCCNDYYEYCPFTTTTQMPSTTDNPSCMNNCGVSFGSCSCDSSCEYYGNCCQDYYAYCDSYTTQVYPSCLYNCGVSFGSCSCASSCEYRGNCCQDYYSYCYYDTTPWPLSTVAHTLETTHLHGTTLMPEGSCGGSLFGSGSFSSPNYPNYYQDNSYCVWQLRQRLTKTSISPSHTCSRVECSSDNMNIVISRSYLNSLGINGNNLYLNDQNCRPDISSYNVVFKFPINTCGTVRKFDFGRIVYTNALRAFSSDYGEITRQSLFKLNVSCRMEQDSVSQIIYEVDHHNNVSISGSGRFNTSMAFYTSSNFYYQVTQVPYKVKLNQDLYVKVSLKRGDSTLVVFLDTCVASSSPHDFQTRSYNLIRNGCRADPTFYYYSSGSQPYATFKFKAFQFLRATEHVYLQCKVLICPASDYNSRCRRGCSRRRVARELSSEHETETVVLGPITLQEPEEKGAQEKTKVNLELTWNSQK
ncbi:hypothetical protein WMY93_018003 [Mugilogobius chulae]|uniref:Deleted in malignant brain tumors 1 protein-like n=1 Tax=Mugilogobius chulae TaxID=88201 RepID=A0AAW0NLV6_9GOBI